MKERGITLIELLIVIAIIGVIAVIAMPNPDQARNAGKAGQCKAQLQEIETAVEMYYSEHGVYPKDDTVNNVTWLQQLVQQGYLKRVPVCPEAAKVSGVAYSIKDDPAATPAKFNYLGHSEASPNQTDNPYPAGRAFCNYHGTLDEFFPGGHATTIPAEPPGGGPTDPPVEG